MSTFTYSKLLIIPVAVTLAACGSNTGTTETDSGSSSAGPSTEGPGTSTTSTPVTTSMSGTEGSGSATEGMTTDPQPTTTATPGTTGDTTGTPGTTTVEPGTTTVEPGTTGGTTMGVEPGSSSGGDSTTSTTGDASTSTTDDSTTGNMQQCQPGDGMGMGMVDKSYIWIASQNEGSIAKVNTLTLVEEGRYRTGPSGGTESPSRTAVSADGKFVVVNGRGTGRSTMIAADKADCIDKNGNGVIDTSNGPADVRAWGADECVIWSIVLPVAGGIQSGPRGVTWTPGTWNFETCEWEDPKIWLGYMSQQAGTAHVVRIDGLTGVVEQTIPVPAWKGSGYAPYGGALDPKFQPWFTGLRGEAIRVNSDEVPITLSRFTPPNNVQAYGMTVDQDGNPWIGGCSGPVSTFDVQANQWFSVAGTSACHRGLAAGEKFVWIASNGPCGLVQVDRLTRQLVKKHTPPQCSTAIGVSIDIEGFVWLVDQAGWAWKIDQDNVLWDKKVNVTGSHYVYSDMTGGQVRSILPQ